MATGKKARSLVAWWRQEAPSIRRARITMLVIMLGWLVTWSLQNAVDPLVGGEGASWAGTSIWLVVALTAAVLLLWLFAWIFERTGRGWFAAAVETDSAERGRHILVSGISRPDGTSGRRDDLDILVELLECARGYGKPEGGLGIDHEGVVEAANTMTTLGPDCVARLCGLLTMTIADARKAWGEKRGPLAPLLSGNSIVQNLRAVEGHLRHQTGTRRLLVLLIPSPRPEGGDAAADQDVKRLERFGLLLGGFYGQEVRVAWLDDYGSARRTVDYEAYDEVRDAVETCFRSLRDPHSPLAFRGFLAAAVPALADLPADRPWRRYDRHVSLDITPGLKTFSIAAAVATMNGAATITYVTSRGTGSGGGVFKVLDGRINVIGDEAP